MSISPLLFGLETRFQNHTLLVNKPNGRKTSPKEAMRQPCQEPGRAGREGTGSSQKSGPASAARGTTLAFLLEFQGQTRATGRWSYDVEVRGPKTRPRELAIVAPSHCRDCPVLWPATSLAACTARRPRQPSELHKAEQPLSPRSLLQTPSISDSQMLLHLFKHEHGTIQRTSVKLKSKSG